MNTLNNQKHTLTSWFRSLRRTTRIALVIALLMGIGIVAYAASVLFGTAHSTTNLSKERYVEVIAPPINS